MIFIDFIIVCLHPYFVLFFHHLFILCSSVFSHNEEIDEDIGSILHLYFVLFLHLMASSYLFILSSSISSQEDTYRRKVAHKSTYHIGVHTTAHQREIERREDREKRRRNREGKCERDEERRYRTETVMQMRENMEEIHQWRENKIRKKDR